LGWEYIEVTLTGFLDRNKKELSEEGRKSGIKVATKEENREKEKKRKQERKISKRM
jgi:hypothetical protein